MNRITKTLLTLAILISFIGSATAATCNTGSTCSTSTTASTCSFKITKCSSCADLITCKNGYCYATLQHGVKYTLTPSCGSCSCYWSIKDANNKQIGKSYSKNPSVTFPKAGNYFIVLSVGKCSKTVRVTVK